MDMSTTAIFTPSAELFSSKTYTITVEESARDIFGNNMTSRFTSTFVTKANDTDTTRPAVQSTVPIGGLTDVEVTQNVAVFFSEKMSKTSVEAAFSMQAGGLSVGGSFSWDSQGESCIFTPYGALGYSTTYIVTIGTAARDAAGNSMASTYSFSFITKSSNDVLPPTVTDVYPSNGETGVSAYATVMLTFSEWMNNSATMNAFHLSSTSGEVSGTVQWKNKNTTMIFTPSQGLLPSTEYTVKVETSASDLVGNRMSSEFRSTFVTRNDGTDTSAPVIEHVQSGNSEVGTAFHLTANVTDVSRLASVTLAYVDVTGAYHSIAMGLGLTFFDATIPAQIAPGTVRYTIQAQDESGNAATSAEYALRVFDTTPPSIRIVSPSSGTVVSSLINIESVANDNYGISSVEFFVDGVSAMNDTVEPYVFPFNPSKVDNGSHAINLVAYDLSGMTSFASVDVSVNRLDTSPPTLTMVYPSDGMVGVNTSVEIFVAFSEEMNASSTISAISLETGGIWIELSKTWQDGCSIAADPLADLRYSTTYRLHINASAMDIAGNSLQGDLQFTFTTQSESGGQTVSGFVTVGVIPIVGATVSDGYRTVLTDKYGNFVFPDIPSGSYSFSVAKWNYSCEQMVRVTVNNGQSVSGIKFLMTPAAGASAICGIIRDDDNSTTVMGALVTVIETSQTAFSDANGRFVVSKVMPGTYTLKIAKLLYKTNTVANVVVSQGENAEVISFNLSSTIGSASSGVTNPNAMAIGDLALPFAIGAGLAALAGGMVMRGPWRSERRKLFNRGPEESLDPANDMVLEETVLVSPMVSRESAELDQLVEVISSGGPKRSRVISELDAEGKEDFERGLKELEKLK
jgi:methionine-rich copper-binding protein CopC